MTIPEIPGSSPINPTNGPQSAASSQRANASDAPLPLVSETTETEQTDQTPPQKRAQQNLENAIKNKNAYYNQTGPFGWIGQAIDRQKIGSEIVISGLKGKTLGEVKEMYNLPDGSLRHMRVSGGGNFDLHKVPDDSVYVNVNDVANGLGITVDQLKDMFPDEQFSTWYFGTGK